MTIIPPQRMIFGRGLFPGANIVALGRHLVPDVTYLAHPGLTLLPDGRIQVTGPAGVGEWNCFATVNIASGSGTERTNVAIALTYNAAEIPSTRRYIYCRQSGYGAEASLFARLTNLAFGDIIGILAFRGGTDIMQVTAYGISGYMEKIDR